MRSSLASGVTRREIWAWAMFGQPMSLYTWAGLLLCLGGVYLARGERVPKAEFSVEKV